jgi:hypothetical protein
MADQKQKQKFDEQWKRLQSLSGEQRPEAKPKIASTKVIQIFQEVAKERVEKAESEFKGKLISILEAKLALDKVIAKGREELAKKEEQEYEVLNRELSAAYSMLENAQKQGQNLVTAAQGGSMLASIPSEESSAIEGENTTNSSAKDENKQD